MNVKQDLNIYTMMLLTAFVALLIGCIALAIEMSRYPGGTPWNSSGMRVAISVEPKVGVDGLDAVVETQQV